MIPFSTYTGSGFIDKFDFTYFKKCVDLEMMKKLNEKIFRKVWFIKEKVQVAIELVLIKDISIETFLNSRTKYLDCNSHISHNNNNNYGKLFNFVNDLRLQEKLGIIFLSISDNIQGLIHFTSMIKYIENNLLSMLKKKKIIKREIKHLEDFEYTITPKIDTTNDDKILCEDGFENCIRKWFPYLNQQSLKNEYSFENDYYKITIKQKVLVRNEQIQFYSIIENYESSNFKLNLFLRDFISIILQSEQVFRKINNLEKNFDYKENTSLKEYVQKLIFEYSKVHSQIVRNSFKFSSEIREFEKVYKIISKIIEILFKENLKDNLQNLMEFLINNVNDSKLLNDNLEKDEFNYLYNFVDMSSKKE